MGEKFNLTWHTFPLHGKNLFQQLMETGKYSDVTLVSDNQHIYKAHKFVLSSCSTFFETIFENNPQNSSIFLWGVNHEELKSILQFIYLGEATFYQERMNEFMNVAKDLSIKEIGENVVDDHDDEVANVQALQNERVIDEHVEIQQRSSPDVPLKENKNNHFQPKNKYKISLNDENKYACEQCEYETQFKSTLVRHVKGVHEKIKFPCTYCNYNATRLDSLKTHINAKHLGVKFPCTQCDYQGSSSSHLYHHVKSKHTN